jgi:hypothetical protein
MRRLRLPAALDVDGARSVLAASPSSEIGVAPYDRVLGGRFDGGGADVGREPLTARGIGGEAEVAGLHFGNIAAAGLMLCSVATLGAGTSRFTMRTCEGAAGAATSGTPAAVEGAATTAVTGTTGGSC